MPLTPDPSLPSYDQMAQMISDLRYRLRVLEDDARRYWFIRGNHARASSPHMDGTMQFRLAGGFNGRHKTFDAAVDAAMFDSRRME